ncbi:MOSC domain-containing protein [Spirillospora sp. CA-294931]|uniref:MOSC domain-containing protein n=1 Tax=Spirillospora sp. CA-294931 TaxID=3240042 RepID=UPI003D8EE4F5
MAVVRELITYPIKGCAGVALGEARLTEAGLAHDRAFMVVSEDGVFRTLRTHPRLALAAPVVDGDRLTLRAHGARELEFEFAVDGPRRDVTLFGAPFQGIDQGDEAAAWFSALLGEPSRLVRVPPDHDRVTDGETPGTSGYADSGAVHALSLASLDELNRRLERPLPLARFRPNIVIGGWDEPHAEDLVRRVVVGNTELAFAKLAVRCVVTTVDTERGVKAGPEPLRTLATYRRAAKGVILGTKFSVVRTGKIAVGDALDVTAWAEPAS